MSASTRFQAHAYFFQQTRCREDNFAWDLVLSTMSFPKKVPALEILYLYSDLKVYIISLLLYQDLLYCKLKCEQVFITSLNTPKQPDNTKTVFKDNGTHFWMAVSFDIVLQSKERIFFFLSLTEYVTSRYSEWAGTSWISNA